MTDGYAPTGLPSKCNLCKNSNNTCVNLQNDIRRILAVAEITGVPSWNIRPILSLICSRCLLFIESLTESSNLLRSRCTNALRSQNDTQLTPLTAYSSTIGSVLHQALTPSLDIGANNVLLPSMTATTAVVATEPCHTYDDGQGSSIESSIRTPSPQDDVLSLLEVHHESIVSPLATKLDGAYCRSMGNTSCKSICQDDVASIASESSKHNRTKEYCLKTSKPKRIVAKQQLPVRRKTRSCSLYVSATTEEQSKDSAMDMTHGQSTKEYCLKTSKPKRIVAKHQLPARRKMRSYSLYVSTAKEEQSKDSAMDMTHGQSTKEYCLKTSKPKRIVAKQQLPVRRKTRSCSLYVSATKEEQSKDSAMDMTHGQSTKEYCLKTSKPKRNVAKNQLPVRRKTRSCSLYVSAAKEEQSKDSAMDMTHGQSAKEYCLKTSKPKRNVAKKQLPTRRKTPSYSLYVSAATAEKSNDSAMDMIHGQSAKEYCLKTSKPKRTVAKQQLPVRRKTRSCSLYVSATKEEQSKDSAMDMTHGQSTKEYCLKTSKPKRIVAKQQLPVRRMTRSYSLYLAVPMENTSRESAKNKWTNDQSTEKECLKTAKAKRAKTVTNSDTNRPSEKVDDSRLSETRPTPVLHFCPLCPVTFQSVFQLCGHMRVHSKLFNCDICRHKYRTQQQLRLHRAKCMNINIVDKHQLPARRMTRLYSKNFIDIELISSAGNKSKDTVPQDPYAEDDDEFL